MPPNEVRIGIANGKLVEISFFFLRKKMWNDDDAHAASLTRGSVA